MAGWDPYQVGPGARRIAGLAGSWCGGGVRYGGAGLSGGRWAGRRLGWCGSVGEPSVGAGVSAARYRTVLGAWMRSAMGYGPAPGLATESGPSLVT
jgi:hypothetical protein